MKHLSRLFRSSFICLLAVIFAACNQPVTGGPGPSVWIDYPSNGMAFPVGSIIVLSHSSSTIEIEQVELYVNDTLVRADLKPDPAASLVPMSQPWAPEGPGAYTLEVRALDAEGNYGRSLPIRITIIDLTSTPLAETGTLTPNPTETSTPTFTPIPESSSPTATFTKNANCREGPGTEYEAVDAFLAGTTLPIDGRNEDGSWLQVRKPSGSHCWVAASTATISGDINSVAVISAPPPPVATNPPTVVILQPPAAPANVNVASRVCAGSTYTVTLGWDDQADNEAGYRIYRNGALIATLGANSESYTDSPPVGGPYTYSVESFNDAGPADGATSDPGCIF